MLALADPVAFSFARHAGKGERRRNNSYCNTIIQARMSIGELGP